MAKKSSTNKQNEVKKSSKKQSKHEKPGFLNRVKKFFQGLAKEIKLVVWPSKKSVKETTIVVLVVVALVMVLVFVTDSIMVGLLNLLGFNTAPVTGNPEPAPTTVTTTETVEEEETQITTSLLEE